MNNTERNAKICNHYVVDGMTYAAIAERFSLTKARIGQILRSHGVHKSDRHRTKLEMLGVMLPEPVKSALRVEAEKRGVTMSDMTAEILTGILGELGYTLEEVTK